MEVKLEKENFERLLNYCLHHKNSGRMKYFWEVSIENEGYNDFLDWLEKCDDALLTYAFTVIKHHEGHKLLYGFTNFEITEDDTVSCFDFCFANDDILSHKFRQWYYESECILVPFSLLGFFKVMDVISNNIDNIKPFLPDEN